MSGLANNIDILMIGRVIQGAGSGMVVPLITTLLVRAANGQNLGRLMSTVGLPMVLVPILGPTVGGFIINQLDWHWIFYINIPIVLIALGLLWQLMPSFPPVATTKNFDIVGFVLLGGMFSALLLGIVNLSSSDSLSALNVLLPLFIGLDLLVAYVVYAAKFPKRALVSLRLFKTPNFSGSAVILLMSGIAVNGAMFLLPMYLQNIRGLSVVWSGLYLVSQA